MTGKHKAKTKRSVCLLLAAGACCTAESALAATGVANEVRAWNIPADDAVASVRVFGAQSGVAVSGVQKDLDGKRLNAVNGSLTIDVALRQLVAGTGLAYAYDTSGGAVTITVGNPGRLATMADAGQEPLPATAPALKPPSPIEQIIVTARKREENLQDVPISADVISGETLAKENLVTLTDVAETIPSIHVNGTGAGGQFFIRGVGSGANQTFDQSVGTFIDDIYHGRTRVADEAFLDLDRVEILNGPQSTFFGNNAVAGAFNIVTAKPTGSLEASARALYGQYGQYAGEGVLNIPLGQELAVRIAAIGDGLSGWQSNPFAGHDQPDRDSKAARITFSYQPTNNFDATLKIEGGTDDDSDGSQIGDCPPPPPFVVAGFCKIALQAGFPTGITHGENTTNSGQGVNLSTFEDVLTLHYRIGDQTLTSVTGFYNYHFQQNVDADGTPEQLFTIQFAERYHQASQELRIASPSGDTLQYMAGLYFQSDGLHLHGGDQDFFFDTLPIETDVAKRPALAALVPYLPLAATTPNDGVYSQDERSYAAFGSLGWNVTDRLKLTTGVRGSWVDKTASQSAFYGTATQAYGGIVPLPANLQPLAASVLGAQSPPWIASEWSHGVMPSAQVEYKFDSNAMWYFSYSRGFLAGVPTGGVTNGVATPPLRAEYVNAYEAGLKSKWVNDHLRLNLDVFRSDYRDLQVASAIFNSAGMVTPEQTNAASSRTQGVEFQEEWVVTEGFRLRSAITYLDARYLSYDNVALTAIQSFCRTSATLAACQQQFPGGVPPLQSLSGEPTNFSPKWSGSVGALYAAALPRGFHFTGEVDVYGSTRYFFANNGTDDPELMQAGYARLDGRLSLDGPNGHWGADVILKNLTNRLIVDGGTGGTSLPTSTGSTVIQTEQPRNVAAQIRYRW